MLSPLLAESYPVAFPYDPAQAEQLLEQAGFPRGPDGVRIRLRYKTTSARDNLEAVLAFQAMLKKIGIEIEIEVVELSVFLASVRKGAYQLYSSRWTGITDGSILHRTLHSGSRDNRAGYRSAGMDALLDRAMTEPDLEKRKAILKDAQSLMANDLPYFPLWYWTGALVLRKGVQGMKAGDISLSGSLEPLTHLR